MTDDQDTVRPQGPRKSSTHRLLAPLLEIGPLLVFFLSNSQCQRLLAVCADEQQRIYVSTSLFMVATAIALPLYRWLEGRWPMMPLVSGIFVFIFGGLTLWLQDRFFIQIKPTVVNVLFGSILVGGMLLGRPLLKPLFGTAFQLTDKGWALLTWRWGFFFFVLAAVNEIMWRNFSFETWTASKLALSMPLTLVFAIAQTPLLKRHWDGEDNPFKAG